VRDGRKQLFVLRPAHYDAGIRGADGLFELSGGMGKREWYSDPASLPGAEQQSGEIKAGCQEKCDTRFLQVGAAFEQRSSDALRYIAQLRVRVLTRGCADGDA
jgi:hypothetical protein